MYGLGMGNQGNIYRGLAAHQLLAETIELSTRIADLEARRVAAVAVVEERCTRADHGFASTKQWLASTTLLTPGHAARIVALGAGLIEFPQIAEAVDAARVSLDHALLIVEFAKNPPKAMPDDAMPECLGLLLNTADGPLARTKQVEEAISKLHRVFESDDKPHSEDPDFNVLTATKTLVGRVSVRADLDALTGEKLLTALSKYSAPQPSVDGTPDTRTPARRRADALAQLLSTVLAFGDLGTEAGERPQLSVHVNVRDLAGSGFGEHRGFGEHDADCATESAQRPDLAQLWRSRDIARAPWTGPLTITAARILGCDSEVTPIFLDEHGVPLAVGRSQRTVTKAQRRALAARDHGCAFPGCTAPPAWCEGHHIQHWVDGGPTDLDNLVLLCGAHHRTLHTTDWEIAIGPDRYPLFRPPASVDPSRRPISTAAA